MVKKADAGDIVGQRVVLIAPQDTALTLYGKLCEAAGRLLDEVLPLMKEGRAPRIPQDISRGSYFGGRRPEDGRIDWTWPAIRIYNLIRAVTDPYPGAFATLADGAKLLIWWAETEEAGGAPAKDPGTVEIEGDRVWVRAGQGRIRLLDVEAGGARIKAEQISRYFADKEGTVLS
jgi:methionyl-tRNA formyltransferase